MTAAARTTRQPAPLGPVALSEPRARPPAPASPSPPPRRPPDRRPNRSHLLPRTRRGRMSSATAPPITTSPTTTHAQSLTIRLDGITAADYLTWVRDPEPPALDHGLRSVAISAEPLGELIDIELAWSEQPPTTPTAAAVAAGFALIPEVVTVRSATCAVDRHRPTRVAHRSRRLLRACLPARDRQTGVSRTATSPETVTGTPEITMSGVRRVRRAFRRTGR